LVIVEVLSICLVGAVAGMLLAAQLLFPLIAAAFELEAISMPSNVVALGIAMSVALAVVTGLLPALRAGRLSIVDALAKR